MISTLHFNALVLYAFKWSIQLFREGFNDQLYFEKPIKNEQALLVSYPHRVRLSNLISLTACASSVAQFQQPFFLLKHYARRTLKVQNISTFTKFNLVGRRFKDDKFSRFQCKEKQGFFAAALTSTCIHRESCPIQSN